MHSKKEQFEILSRELLGKLNDVSSFSDLFFPFGYTLPVEIEEKYFGRSQKLRTIMIRAMVVIDNSFKKFKIFPSHDIMVTYIETQKDLLYAWITDSMQEYENLLRNRGVEPLDLHNEGDLEAILNSEPDKDKAEDKAVKMALDGFKKVLRNIESEINKASMVAIKEIGSSEEAKMLDIEYNGSAGGFSDFIHNTISNLFK